MRNALLAIAMALWVSTAYAGDLGFPDDRKDREWVPAFIMDEIFWEALEDAGKVETKHAVWRVFERKYKCEPEVILGLLTKQEGKAVVILFARCRRVTS